MCCSQSRVAEEVAVGWEGQVEDPVGERHLAREEDQVRERATGLVLA